MNRPTSRTNQSSSAAGQAPDGATLPTQPGPGSGHTAPEPSTLASPAAGDIPPALANHPPYRVLGLLGSGGMGAVYRAEHRLMQRPVALKVINPRFTDSSGAVERFRREVVAAAKLSHPNIVAAYDAEQAGDLHFLAMELVTGMSLSELLERRGRLSVADACDYVRQAALGLQHAHEKGMVHRDIKPHNLMLTPEGQVKVLDFGLARFVSESGQGGGLTQVGASMGTPDYMAPEQAQDARAADIRADIYSLGCTLYCLLTGQRPFPEGDFFAKVMAHIQQTPKPVTDFRNDVPPEVCRIVERMMAKDPARRFQTPGEVAAALAPFARPARAAAEEATEVGPPAAAVARAPAARRATPPRRRWPWAVAALALALLVAAGALAVVVLRLPGPGTNEVAVAPSARETAKAARPVTPEVPPVTTARAAPAATAKAPPPVAEDRPLAWPAAELRQGKILAPDLGKAERLVRYDFSDPRSGWPVGPHPRLAVERGYATGHYFLKSARRLSFFEGRGDRFSGCACELVGRVRGLSPTGWGLTLSHASGDAHRLIVWVTLNRKGLDITTTGLEPGEGEGPHAEGIVAPAAKPVEEYNRLLVVFRGRRLEAYVNGLAAGDPVVVPAGLAPANVGVGVHFGPRGGEVELQRLTIWSADRLPTPEARGAVPK